MHFPVVLVPTIIPELRRIEVTEDGVVVGAANTLTSLEKVLTEIIAKRPRT